MVRSQLKNVLRVKGSLDLPLSIEHRLCESLDWLSVEGRDTLL